MGKEKNLSDFAEEYIEKGRKKFGRTPTYGEIEEIIAEETKKEFKLDEKIKDNANESWSGYTGKIEVEDIKEFIKIVENIVLNPKTTLIRKVAQIRAKAGPKLSKNGKRI